MALTGIHELWKYNPVMIENQAPDIAHWKNVEIEELPRVLKFHPVEIRTLTSLVPDQIDAFNRMGYLTGLSVFPSEEMDELRGYFDELLSRQVETPTQSPLPT